MGRTKRAAAVIGIMHRVIIFTNNEPGAPDILIKGTLAALASLDNVELAAVCLAKPQTFLGAFCRHLMDRTLLNIESLLDSKLKRRHPLPLPINLNRLAQRLHFRVLVPPEGDINHPRFIAQIRNEIRPTIALSFYCLQKFSPNLLAVFSHAVNYHNGLLPKYRGRKATAWSVYQGEQETGFTFHHMTKRIDEGPILAQEALPISANQSSLDLDFEKAIMAATHISRVLRMVVDGNPGKPQLGGNSSYFSIEDHRGLTRIPAPSILSSVELARRLRAFECLRMRIAGKWHEVTKIKLVTNPVGKSGRFCFLASDGVMIVPVRFQHLPYSIYRAFAWVLKKQRPRKVAL